MPRMTASKLTRGRVRTAKPLASPAKVREYIVSIASPRGGGRFVVEATSPTEAATIAYRRKFPRARRAMKGTEVIVTDTRRRKNAQTFFRKD